MTEAIVQARSFLFVPATRPERISKALASGADAVIVDLEDAVAPEDKDAARLLLAMAFEAIAEPSRTRIVIRLNAAATPWFDADLELASRLATKGLAAVMLSKSESADSLADLADGPSVIPLVETVEGHARAADLAAAPRVVRLAFGNLDFQADGGMHCGPDEGELAPVRLALVLASRRAGIAAPIDGVTAATADPAAVDASARRAYRLGFGGKLCIHPAQVAHVHQAFAPEPEQLEWARRVVEAARRHAGAFRLDGRMVDAPIVRLAERLIAADRL